MKNYYQILGLEEGATLDEIKAAYREYVVKFHPDKHNGDTFFKERFQEVQEAYDYLRTHYTGCNEFVDERGNTTVSSVKMPSSSDIEFTSSSKQVYEGDTVTLKWNVRFPCSISLNVDTDKSYFDRTRYDLPLHGSTEIHIGKVEEEVVITLHCSINNRTISKEIHLIRNRTIDVMLHNDKRYMRLIKINKAIKSIFKVLPLVLTVPYIIMLCAISETFPAYTDNTILNNVIEWGAYILGWLMICYIVPLVMEIQITSPINDKIEQRIREANSKYN